MTLPNLCLPYNTPRSRADHLAVWNDKYPNHYMDEETVTNGNMHIQRRSERLNVHNQNDFAVWNDSRSYNDATVSEWRE